MNRQRLIRKAFTVLLREGEAGQLPRSSFDYAKEVGDGLGSAVITAPAFWVSRQFPEAPIKLRDPKGELHTDHAIITLLNNPNPWYSGGDLFMALALDYTINGNAYYEITRGRGNMPTELVYQPSYSITPKGTSTELVTHYEQEGTGTGVRSIAADDMGHPRFGIDPRNPKLGVSAIHSLLREIFTDDEAANMIASVLRNMGVPGLIISPGDPEGTLGPESRNRLKDYFRRIFNGDKTGEPLVAENAIKINTLDVDLSKMALDKLRQIPEERVTAVMGIPAAVVGFGTGLEQTKVGATMKEMRELAYENVIVPMQRVFAGEMNHTLLPEFLPDPTGWSLVFDNSNVRVLQEDQTQMSDRVIRQWQGGLISKAEGRVELGRDFLPSDKVYRQGFSDIYVPVGSDATTTTDDDEPKDWIAEQLKNIATKGAQEDRIALRDRFRLDVEKLSRSWADDLQKSFDAMGEVAARVWLAVADTVLAGRNGSPTKQVSEEDRAIVDLLILQEAELAGLAIDYEAQYLSVLRQTNKSLDSIIGLGVNLTEPMEQQIISLGGTRKGLVDFTEQTRRAMYNAVAQGRADQLGPQAIARQIRSAIPAGPWGSSATRAEVIARTETKFAQNVSSIRIYQESPNVDQVQVFDAQLGDTDGPCVEIDGKIFTTEEAALIPPLEHPNCTRSFAPVVSEAD